MNPRKVFVSHGGTDTWVACQIRRGIMEAGAEAFLDVADLHAGDDFAERIRDALESADEVLVLWTPWSLDRPFVLVEVGAAWIRRIPLIQVLHGVSAGELQTRTSFPVQFKAMQMLSLNDMDTYFQELRQRTGG